MAGRVNSTPVSDAGDTDGWYHKAGNRARSISDLNPHAQALGANLVHTSPLSRKIITPMPQLVSCSKDLSDTWRFGNIYRD
jgi:hypothetical protein